MKTATQPLQLKGDPAAATIPRTYIYCTAKPSDHIMVKATSDAAQYAKAQGWAYHEIESGHEPEIERPDEVIEILLSLA